MSLKLKDLRYQKTAISPENMLQNLKKDLEINVSVGIWYFTPGGGRFHERFVQEATIPERIEMAAEMAKFGVKGIEAHYPDEVNEENAHLFKQLEAMHFALQDDRQDNQIHPSGFQYIQGLFATMRAVDQITNRL